MGRLAWTNSSNDSSGTGLHLHCFFFYSTAGRFVAPGPRGSGSRGPRREIMSVVGRGWYKPAVEETGFADLLRLMDERSTVFRAAVASAPSLDVRVPTRPEWTLFDLVQHLGEGRRRWAATVAAGLMTLPRPVPAPVVPQACSATDESFPGGSNCVAGGSLQGGHPYLLLIQIPPTSWRDPRTGRKKRTKFSQYQIVLLEEGSRRRGSVLCCGCKSIIA